MTLMELTPDVVESLDRHWGQANVEVIKAQIAYGELASHGPATDESLSAAWLRLWHAQERERQLSSALDRLGCR
jgi:hypothetical protein